MNIRCPNCQGQTPVPNDAKAGTVLCRFCKNPLNFQGARQPVKPAGKWFVLIGGKQSGPVSEEALASLLQKGQVGPDTYVWAQGMPQWMRAQQVPALAALLTPAKPPEKTSKPPQPKAPAKQKEAPLAAEGVGEVTRYFIAQAGMNSRNPPWKIVLAVVLAIAFPVGVLYMLSELNVVPLKVTRVDDSGREVKDSVFSIEGVSGLRDRLLGKKPAARSAVKGPERPRPHRPEAKPPQGPEPVPTKSDELGALYGDDDRVDIGPQARQPLASVKGGEDGGPPSAEVATVVASVQPAFQFCIEQELRKNPKFRGGRINLVATVGSSGSVKQANIDRRDVNGSKLGECLKAKARRMVFNSFAGDDVDVEIPLILGAGF